MTKSILAAALAVALGAIASAQAQPMKMPAASTPAKIGTGVGVIRAVDPKTGMVTIQHEPIAAIGWPAMTMSFRPASPAVMHAAKVGQKVAFGVRVSGRAAEVTSIKPK